MPTAAGFQDVDDPADNPAVRRGLTPGRFVGSAPSIEANCSSVSQNRFDIVTSRSGGEMWEAVAEAVLVELPLAALCALALDRQWVPPTINYQNPDPACDLDVVPNHGREEKLKYIMSNSFGFGGINACVILGKVS